MVFAIFIHPCSIMTHYYLFDEGKASGLSLSEGIARVYEQNFPGRVTLQARKTLCAVTLKGSGNK